MKSKHLVAALAAFALLSPLRAEDTKYPPINPALLYWQAAAELPQLTADQAKDLNGMAEGRLPFDAAKAKTLLVSKTTLKLLREATDSTATCDWGLPTEDGPFMVLPHIAKMREMSSLAVLKAEALFAEGKVKDGLEWMLAAHRMARHVGATDLLISNLVQFYIEGKILRAAARHCLGWDEDARHFYATALQALPPLHPTQDAYRGEMVLVDWMEHRLNPNGQPQQDLEQFLKGLATKPTDSEEALAEEITPGALAAALAEFRAMLNRTTPVFGKPWPESQRELKALAAEAARSTHFIVRNGFPTIAGVADKQFAIATLRTMLDAALQHGAQLDEAAAATYRDAFEGEPLRLKKAGDGTLTLFTAHQHPAGTDLDLQLGK